MSSGVRATGFAVRLTGVRAVLPGPVSAGPVAGAGSRSLS